CAKVTRGRTLYW
nr:immunoglobulin heavy chain junction region [Macaca mulatta]MOY30200.1 immunoglobulin heavy chain junction region [Macaca mulatta]